MMQDWNALADEAFRAEVIRFVEERCPPDLRYAPRRMRWAEVKPWYMALSAAGWLAPGWPVEYGGMGLTASKHLVFIEEMERCGAPRLPDQGMMNLGPVLIACGTEAQRREYLPKILSGEHIWCQGYSEPNAGSDLASLRTEARLEGDSFVINGQKIWTSVAFDANHMFALVRTDKTVRKQAGISFVMLDMNQPGITVRPIRNIAGHTEFCEVFLDDVRTPRSNLVGPLHDGWRVAKTLLGFERVWSGSPRQSLIVLYRLEQVARALGRMQDPVFVDRFTQVSFDVLDLASTYERFAQQLRLGQGFGPEVSLLKVWATETAQRVTELLVETAAECGGLLGNVEVGAEALEVLYPFLEYRGYTIYGGSNQIQRNILAKQALRLPG
jgi:alkylation response protein AidB-like acyl-CoA dehydrogenase